MRDDVKDVLEGRACYDDLDPPKQELVRRIRTERVKATRESLNFAAEFRAAGEKTWSVADEDGRTAIRDM